jgi:hypothetical protein
VESVPVPVPDPDPEPVPKPPYLPYFISLSSS